VARRYERAWLSHDVLAGVVLTALLIPAGIGYAEAAGLPSQRPRCVTLAAPAGAPEPHALAPIDLGQHRMRSSRGRLVLHASFVAADEDGMLGRPRDRGRCRADAETLEPGQSACAEHDQISGMVP
jgi:hypothetical protein